MTYDITEEGTKYMKSLIHRMRRSGREDVHLALLRHIFNECEMYGECRGEDRWPFMSVLREELPGLSYREAEREVMNVLPALEEAGYICELRR